MHDHFFAKGGIAASANHILRQAVERHKARLQAEFTKARLRRRCGTVQALKEVLVAETPITTATQPQLRWIRVNTLKSTLEAQSLDLLAPYKRVRDLVDVGHAPSDPRYCVDDNVPNLVAVPSDTSLTRTSPYLNGEIILQDKASCFPAHLLTGDNVHVGDIIDACAAPGNKTTHLAAILGARSRKFGQRSRIFACERDPKRSTILQAMIHKAGAKQVTVLPKQDFLALDPSADQFGSVTHLLLDPSCSGSGILGREDIPTLALPKDPRSDRNNNHTPKHSKKRKRTDNEPIISTPSIDNDEEQPAATTSKEPARLAKLANLQSRIIEHAFTFPAARRITYSTCSIHSEENEDVVLRVLQSAAGVQHGWRVATRSSHPAGLRAWRHRGVASPAREGGGRVLSEDELEGCIRCYPNDEMGTMGFFVVCFERDVDVKSTTAKADGVGQDEWDGFSD